MSSVMSETLYEILQNGGTKLDMSTENVPNLKTYSGDIIHPLGRIMVRVEHMEKFCNLPMGRDWLEQLNVHWPYVQKL